MKTERSNKGMGRQLTTINNLVLIKRTIMHCNAYAPSQAAVLAIAEFEASE